MNRAHYGEGGKADEETDGKTPNQPLQTEGIDQDVGGLMQRSSSKNSFS